MKKYLIISIFMMLFMGWSCTEEDAETTILMTEEVLYTSAEQVRLLGRLITNQAVSASDHGFYLSEDANFSSPVIISLGPKSGPGRFIGQANTLKADTDYFVKSFMDIGNGIEFGNTITLQTLTTAVESYSPSFGTPNQEILILGRNFTSDTKVFFGDQEAQILENLFESRLRVRIPAPKGSSSVKITVKSQDQLLTFPTNFEYQTGAYLLIGSFPEQVHLVDNIFFQAGNQFYIGLGSDRMLRFFDKIFRYDPVNNQWANANFPGTPRSFGFATSNYLGGGIAELGRDPFVMNHSFWRISSNGFVRLKDLPFPSRESIAFEIGNELYVLGGKEGNPFSLRKYNAATDSWTNLPDSFKAFTDFNPHFVYQNKLFVLDTDKTLYSYDPNSGVWNSVSTYPGSLGSGYGFAHVIGNKVYIGGWKRNNEIWEFNLDNSNWYPKNPIPGSFQNITVASFVQNGFIYFTRQQDVNLVGAFPLEFYRFDPNGI